MPPLEIYCKEILHSGCGLIEGKHTWEQCPVQYIYKRIATKHQRKLKVLGVAIGTWVDESEYKLVPK